MERIICRVQTYNWGKQGANSEVARLFAQGHKHFQIDPNQTYAELWMGTHPDGPAVVERGNVRLSTMIARDDSRSMLSIRSAMSDYSSNNSSDDEKEDIHLPFIMKIMSIAKTLSLQVHPNKVQANKLHERDPTNYPDRHHKPELAYALTRFELLCGFRPADEIYKNMLAFPELREVMGNKNAEKFMILFKKGYSQESTELMSALGKAFKYMKLLQNKDPVFVQHQLTSFTSRLRQMTDLSETALIPDTVQVILKMEVDFPGDVGVFGSLYLNHMILQPGECCYYAPQELHAYLSGECVECVGCSNNTIRASLTPKFKDIEALCEVVNYRMTDPSYYLVDANVLPKYEHVTEYAPDCKDFTLHQIKISKASTGNVSTLHPLPTLSRGSIVVIVEGSGVVFDHKPTLAEFNTINSRPYSRGDIFYIPPMQTVTFVQEKGKAENVLAFRTFSDEIGPDHSNRNVRPSSLNAVNFTTTTQFRVEQESDGFL
uniref:Mannose-6-phosphate isomerase n=1 Tax=Rhabditophanes sp. KR3021 TaxID=114890 RepID=A0AC35UAG5_9BILA